MEASSSEGAAEFTSQDSMEATSSEITAEFVSMDSLEASISETAAALASQDSMEASSTEITRLDDPESLNFANALYMDIWQTFEISNGPGDPYTGGLYEDSKFYNVDICNAVLCEQILTRSFYQCYLFVPLKPYNLKDATTAVTLCKTLCKRAGLKTKEWDSYKKLLRFSALIAEFFLYRTTTPMISLELQKAPLIWNFIFKKYFAEKFDTENVWQDLRRYCRKYNRIYSVMENLINKLEHPYESISYSHMFDRKFLREFPETNPGEIDKDMTKVFRCYMSDLERKPKTLAENYREVNIPEYTETDSSSENSSSESSRSDVKLVRLPSLRKAKLRSPTSDDDESSPNKKSKEVFRRVPWDSEPKEAQKRRISKSLDILESGCSRIKYPKLSASP